MIDTAGKPGPAVKGKPLAVNIGIMNVGKSPALNLIVHRHLVFGQSSIEQLRGYDPDSWESSDAIPQGQKSLTTAVSLKDTFANETAELSRSEVVNWDGSKPIIVFGRVTYRDRFGNVYCTPFAHRYFGPTMWEHISEPIDQHKNPFHLTDLCPNTKSF